MYGKVCDWVKGGLGKIVSYLSLAVTGFVSAADLLAQEASTVSVTTAADLIGSLTTVAVVGIGIALSVWALMMIVNLFRRTSSGH